MYEERRRQFAAFAFSYRERLEDVTSGKRLDRYARERERERARERGERLSLPGTDPEAKTDLGLP